MESDDPPGPATAPGDASTSHRRLASASAESSSSQPSRPVPSLAERLGLGAAAGAVSGPSSNSKAEDVAAAEPGTPRATPSRPIALATMSNAISNSPAKSALSPSRGSSSSEEEGMIKEEDAESEEEGEVDESHHRGPPSRERERDREHARSSSGHQYRSERSSPRAASSSAAEQQQQQQHQPLPSSSSSSSSTVMPPARRWGQPAPTPRNDRSDAFVPPHHPPVHAHPDRDRDWERQREQQQRPGPSTMWPPSRYDDVRPPFAQGDRDREPRSASSSAYRQRSAHDDRSTSWSRNRRSASPIERDRRYERRGTERLPSPTVPLSGPNSIGARPPPPLPYPNASLRDDGLDRQGRSWGSGPASAGPSTRWNRWSGRERERGERERDRNDFDESRSGGGAGDSWHPPPSRVNDDRGERGNFRRGSDWRTMDDNFVRSRTPSLQHPQQRAAAGDLAAADVWRRSPEFTRSETSQQPFARSRSSTSNLGATSSPPPPPIIRAPSPPAARGQQRAAWTGGFEPPPRDAGWGGKARRNSQQSSEQPAGEPASSGEPEPTIKVEAQDDIEPSREEAPVVQESEAPAPTPRPLAAEDASTVKDYAVAEIKELAVTQETAETSSPPTVTQQESPPTSPPSLKKEIDSVPSHPPKQAEPSTVDVVDEDQQSPPFSQSAAPTLPAEAQMQAPASASEAAALTVPAIASAPEVTAAVEETPDETQDEQQVAEAKITPPAAEPLVAEAEAPGASTDVDMPDAEAAQPPPAQPSRESESSELKAVLDEAAAVAAASGEKKPDAVVEADATADVTMKTPDSGEGEQDRVGDDDQDRIDEEGASSPLPPQKTDEELEEAKRATILRLITTGKQPDSDETLSKLIAANQRMAEQTTFSLMESAVHGPPPPALEVKIDVYEETPETQRMRSLLTERVKATNKRLAAKTERLRRQYKALNNDWQAHCARLDRAAEARENARKAAGGSNTPQGAGAFAPSTADDSGVNSQTQPSITQPLMTPSISGRSNRRGTQSGGFGFGDAVRSEAEFLEILASLETADMQDPEARAARTATTVPDQLINPDRDALLKYEVDERNHFVANPVSYYLDEFDPDFWSQEEKVIFARKYALWPKQFGKIATALPNKTASQCVYYYYLTKHQPGHDYKAITAARNRNQKRKSRVMKPKKGRGSALMADLKSAKGDDDGGADGGDAPMSPMDARASLMGGDAAGLMPLIEEEEGGAQAAAGATTPGGSTVKRLGDASSSTKPKSGRGGKRVKGQGKGKASAAAAAMAAGDMSLDSPPIRSPSGAVTPAEEASADSDLAAAEALGALSGMMPMTAATAKSTTGGGGGGGKKRKQLDGAPVTPGEDGSPGTGAPPQRKPRQATSSYWSVQERGEFLKGIAIHGKDWKLVAARLNAKSAAQARNYFARNAEVPDFVEAAALGEHHAEQPLSVREQLAMEWAKEKLGVGVPTATGGVAAEGSQQPGSGHSSARPGPSPMMSKESSPEPSGMPPPPRRYGGMGIMSLLNEERPSSSQEQRPPPPRAAPVMHEWYDNAQPPMSSQSTAPSSDREAESTDSEGFAFSSSRASPAMPHAYVPRPSYQQSHSHGSYEGRPYLPEARTRDEGPPPPLPPSSLPSLPRLSTPGGSAGGGLGAPGSSLRSTYSGGGEYPASTSATVASFARPPVYNSSSVRESLPSPLSGGGASSHHHDPLGSGRTSMPPPPTSSLGSRPYGSLHAPSQPQQQQRHSSWSAGHSASSASPASPLPPISSYPPSSSYGDRLAPRQSQTQTSSSQHHRTLAPPPPLSSRSHFSPGGGASSTGSRSASPGGSALPPYRPSSGEAWPSMSSSSSGSASRNLAPPSSGYHQQQRSTSYGSASSSGTPYLPRPSTSPYPPASTSTGSSGAPRVSPFAPPPQSQKEHGGSPLLPPRLQHPQQQHGSGGGGGGGGGGGQTRPGSGQGYEEGRG